MNIIPQIIIAAQILFFIVALILIIYLIFRRIKISKEEDFEKRDN